MLLNQPLFTIVTICFNSSKTIERTIRSVLAQSSKDYEYLVIDGGSTDKTIDIVKKYESAFNGKLKWISEPDNGIYNAFNKGIKLANGIYIWLVNSDDYINPNALSIFTENIQKYGKEIIYSAGMTIVDNDGKKIGKFIFTENQSLYERMNHDSIAFVHPATIIPKKVYEDVGSYDEKYMIMGDYDWSRKAWLCGVKFRFIDAYVTNMYNGGISGVPNFRKNSKDRMYFYSKFYKFPQNFYRYIVWLKRYSKDVIKYYMIKFGFLYREIN